MRFHASQSKWMSKQPDSKLPYFVCHQCNAKWFGAQAICPRCGTRCKSHAQATPPWQNDEYRGRRKHDRAN